MNDVLEEFQKSIDVWVGTRIEEKIKDKNFPEEVKKALFEEVHFYTQSVYEHEDNKNATLEDIRKTIYETLDVRLDKAIEQIEFDLKAEKAIPEALITRQYKQIYKGVNKTIFGNVNTGSVVSYNNLETTTKLSFSPIFAQFIINFTNGIDLANKISQYKGETHPKVKNAIITFGYKVLGSTSYKMSEDVISTESLGYSINGTISEKGNETTDLTLLVIQQLKGEGLEKIPAQIEQYRFSFDEAIEIRNFYNEVAKKTQQTQTMQEALNKSIKKGEQDVVN